MATRQKISRSKRAPKSKKIDAKGIIRQNLHSLSIGLIIVGLILIGSSLLTYKSLKRQPKILRKEISTAARITPTPTPVTKEVIYTVKENDSIATIGKAVCNDDRAYLYIADQNNLYPPYTLQPGDKLSITCQ
ncbi:MAG TPA: LysM peptidoglycan-binding domain-containing protein [Candidatus Saccharimonadales bacterium]|nr:LysM peptidoglycan-binding domain-containing protein [Candidatus Saccharimonadales bacterium]